MANALGPEHTPHSHTISDCEDETSLEESHMAQGLSLASDEEHYTVDVTEASQALGVSLARLSQLTSKGTLSHVRRRVGARWRIFYRRDEIDEMARVHRAVVYHRPASFVPLPLTPLVDRHKPTKDAERVGASGGCEKSSASDDLAPLDPSSPHGSSPSWEPRECDSFASPLFCAQPTTAGFGYGAKQNPLERATDLQEKAALKETVSRLEGAVAVLLARLEGLEDSQANAATELRALRQGVPPSGAALPKGPWASARSHNETTFARHSVERKEPPSLPSTPPKMTRSSKQKRLSLRTAARVRMEKGS